MSGSTRVIYLKVGDELVAQNIPELARVSMTEVLHLQ